MTPEQIRDALEHVKQSEKMIIAQKVGDSVPKNSAEQNEPSYD